MQRPKLFYIHYNGMDRRLDEWVDEEKVLFGEDVLETPTLTPLPVSTTLIITNSSSIPILFTKVFI